MKRSNSATQIHGMRSDLAHRRICYGAMHGLTIVELLMALTITGLIGAAIASMLFAVSHGTAETHDLRSLVVKNKTLTARIASVIRQSEQLLDADDGYVILWTKDLNDNGSPDLLELRRIGLNSATGELIDYTPDASAADATYQFTDDFDTITLSLIDSDILVGQLWATDVAQWQINLDDEDPQAATLVSFRLTLESGTLEDTSVDAVSMRD